MTYAHWGAAWTRIPPPEGTTQALLRQRHAFNKLRQQWMLDVAQHGPEVLNNVRYKIGWNFCGGGAERTRRMNELKDEMPRWLKDPELKDLMQAAGRDAALVDKQRFSNTVRLLEDRMTEFFQSPF